MTELKEQLTKSNINYETAKTIELLKQSCYIVEIKLENGIIIIDSIK